MDPRFFPACLAIAFGIALPALAQSPAPASPLTLPQVLQAARDNVDVSLARRAVAGAAADVVAADRSPVPVLSAKTSSIDLENGVGPGNTLRDKRIDKGVGLDWTLERGNKRTLRTQAAQRNEQAARLDLAEIQLQQQVLAASAFFELVAAQERIEQVAALERSAADLAAAAQRRLRAGDLSQQDTLRTEIEARRAQADLRGAQAERQRAALALAQLTGLRNELRAQATWPAPGPVPAHAPDAEQRADVRAARERVQAAQVALDAANALRKNDVTLGASVDHYPGTSRRLLEDLRTASARSADFEDHIVPRARQVAAMAELAYSRGALTLTDLIEARRTLRAVLLDELAARADYARAHTAWQLRQAAVTP